MSGKRHSLGSLTARAQGQPPDAPACLDPAETSTHELSALAWRLHARKRGGADDDPTIIRHLNDLAAPDRR